MIQTNMLFVQDESKVWPIFVKPLMNKYRQINYYIKTSKSYSKQLNRQYGRFQMNKNKWESVEKGSIVSLPNMF